MQLVFKSSYFLISRVRVLPLFLAFFLMTPFASYSQDIGFCGIGETKAIQPVFEEGEDQYFDRFGNFYKYDDLVSKKKEDANKTNCNGGDFNLVFGAGFNTDQCNTICQVFQDLGQHISIAANGISPRISVEFAPLGTGVLGTGSPIFINDGCGYSDNAVYVQMNYGSLNSNFVTGTLTIASGINWHDSPALDPIPANAFDLYTVTLHEALHIMGYSSLVGFDGNPVNTTYSRWDRFLFDDDINDFVLVDDAPQIPCCTDPILNPLLSFPNDLDDDCANNIFFNNGSNVAQVNADYGGGPVSTNGLAGNILSHLDRCGSPGLDYVMHASLAPAELRRNLMPEEATILTSLGYQNGTGTPPACVLSAAWDRHNYALSNEILFSDLLANDLAPANANVIIHTSSCNNIPSSATVNVLPDRIEILNLPFGFYFICYTIEGCDECEDARVLIINLPQLDECGPCEDGQLFCYGDFEAFWAIASTAIHPQLGFPYCETDNGSNMTPDIVLLPDGSNVVRIGGGLNNEYITLPLNPPLQPGCSIEVCIDASSPGCNNPEIEILLTNNIPCTNAGSPDCAGTNDFCVGTITVDACTSANLSFLNCNDPNYPPELDCSMGVPFVMAIDQDPGMSTYCLQATNTSNTTYDYITVAWSLNNPSGVLYMDNLDVTSDCCNDTIACETKWEIRCYDDYFCVLDGDGNSPYMEWISPAFAGDPNGHCQSLAGLSQGDPLSFMIFVYEDGILQCTAFVDTVLPCPTDNPPCEVDWSIKCFDDYFCVVDGDGNSPYMEWISPAFAGDPNGHCQSLAGLSQGDPLSFMIFVYEDGIEICTLFVDTTLPCQTDTPPCEFSWDIKCFDKYFCVVDENGNSPYMQWISPPFPDEPNGHCQPLKGLEEGQALEFEIYVYEEGILICTLTVNTTLPCATDGLLFEKQLINSNKPPRVELFPNPAASILNIQNKAEQGTRVLIYDSQGRKRNQLLIPAGNTLQHQIENLEEGVYYARYFYEDGSEGNAIRFVIIR